MLPSWETFLSREMLLLGKNYQAEKEFPAGTSQLGNPFGKVSHIRHTASWKHI